MIASGGGDKAVRFWNVITSMPQHTCIGNHCMPHEYMHESDFTYNLRESRAINLSKVR